MRSLSIHRGAGCASEHENVGSWRPDIQGTAKEARNGRNQRRHCDADPRAWHCGGLHTCDDAQYKAANNEPQQSCAVAVGAPATVERGKSTKIGCQTGPQIAYQPANRHRPEAIDARAADTNRPRSGRRFNNVARLTRGRGGGGGTGFFGLSIIAELVVVGGQTAGEAIS